MSQSMLNRITEKTNPPKEPMYSPYGYVIMPDGTTYTLLKQWFHGVVIACLFPEELKAFRLDPKEDEDMNPIPGTGTELVIPDTVDEINVFDFQKFEMSVHSKLDLVRICPSRMMSETSVDLPRDKPCTPEQMQALRLVLTDVLGLKPKSVVNMDHGDVTLAQCYQCAETGKTKYEMGFNDPDSSGDFDD